MFPLSFLSPPPARFAALPALSARRSGPGGTRVVCLHSSTGSQAQWRPLADRLDAFAEVVAPDLFGHGRSPAWPDGLAGTLDVDASAVLALLRADGPGTATGLHLVGHSYGAAVALRIALRAPQQVRSLTLYEPVVFGLLDDAGRDAADPALDEIRDIARSVAALVRAGELADAARIFVAYWGGAAAWHGLSDAQRASVMHRIPAIPKHFDALLAARWSARLLARLQMPVWLMHGSATRAPARAVADRLGGLLPRVQRLELADAGHLGPLTHADAVADAMARALRALPGFPRERTRSTASA